MSRTLKNTPDDTAIVLLGAAVWEGESASPSLRRRTLHASGLVKAGLAGLIVCSGGLGRFPPTEAEMMRRVLEADDVPADSIVLEEASRTTLENVLYSARELQARGIWHVIVVSDKYHLPRAVMCFRALGFAAKGSGPNRADTGTPLRKWLYYYFRELIALPWYLAKLPNLRDRFLVASNQS